MECIAVEILSDQIEDHDNTTLQPLLLMIIQPPLLIVNFFVELSYVVDCNKIRDGTLVENVL
jgi:hypothetical protein